MKLLLKIVILSSFIVSFLVSCGGSGTDRSHSYSLGAESYEFRESEEGSFIVLRGLSDSVEFNYPGDGLEAATGTFSLQNFIRWWDHPSYDERLALTTESITVELEDRVKTFVLSNPHTFTYDPQQDQLMIQVELIGVENKRLHTRTKSPLAVIIKFLTLVKNPSPAACGRETPPENAGLEWKWVGSKFLYDDKGTGARTNLSVYTVRNSLPEGFYAVSELAVPSHHPLLECGDFAVKDVSPEGNLIAPPVYYSLIWNDKSSGGKMNISFLDLQPKPGYRCPGVLASPFYSEPLREWLASMACFHESILEPETAPAPEIWNDRDSGATLSVTLFRRGAPSNPTIMGPFIAVKNYPSSPDQNAREKYYYKVRAN